MRLARPRLAALALTVSAAGALSGCVTDHSTPPPPPQAANATEPLDQYPMRLVRTPDDLALAAHPGGLTPNQHRALGAFAGRWRAYGRGPVVVSAPSDGPDARFAADAAQKVKMALVGLGVPQHAIRLTGYAAGAPGAPLLASFDRLAPEVADCSDKWSNLTSTAANRVPDNWGCSVHANASVQVADPNDIAAPAPMGANDSSRRMVVLGKYRLGLKTSAERDEQARGTLATAVPQ